MTWAAPAWLFGLAAPAAVALALLLFSLRRHRRDSGPRWPRVSRVLASANGFAPVPPQKVMRRPWLLLASACLCIVALARPEWGEVEESVTEQAREVMIALDLSRSMLVDDVSPTRMDRARLLVRSLLNGLRGERVGLIVFAGTAFVQVPLSADYEILKEFLPELNPDYMPQGGTDYDGMLRAALESFSEAADADRFLIILSDGESTTEGWRSHLKELQDRNVRVLSLGIGTPAGGFVPDPKSGYVKDERGAVVLSRLESATLQELAATTQGAYRDASIWVDLPALLEETVALGKLRNFEEQRRTRRLERFQWFLAPAVLLAVLGIWREFAVKPAARSVPVRTTGRKAARAATAAAALILFFVVAPPGRSAAAEAEEPPPAVQAIRDTVARLVANPQHTATDWRELAERTLAFGEQTKSSQQPVPPGPIQDALAAVEQGEQIDPTETDWSGLRQKLEDLLTAPPPQEQQPEQDSKQQDEESQDQEQKQDHQTDSGQDSSAQKGQPQFDQPSDNQQSNDQQQNQPSPGESSEDSQPPNSEQNRSPGQNTGDNQQSQPDNQSPPPVSGQMGDLAPPEAKEPQPETISNEPPPAGGETKKIGGQRAGSPATESLDPKQAAALQELRQVQDRDTPARLFELLEGEAAPTQPGPNW